MNRNRIFIGIGIAVLFQTAILVQMVWSQITLLSSPTEVVLQTTPVDPRDIFRGDYVILDYTISSFSDGEVPIDSNVTPGEHAYVVLKVGAPYATPVRVEATAPTSIREGEAVIRGTVNWSNLDISPTTGDECTDCQVLSIAYPIDSYFVPEGTGGELEEHRNARALGIIVALNEDGDAAIKGLMIDGVKIYDTPLF